MSEAFEQIRGAIEKGKIAGSWLITGGSEVEKKHFINECCTILFNKNFNEFSPFHPDVKWLECGLTEEAKKEIQKNILAGKAVENILPIARRREITVDDVREGIQFLSLKSGAKTWRVLVVNPADKMNENAANALLKALEEPPERCIIFLLCQNMGRILPTIKSRCRKIVLKPLSSSELKEKIQNKFPALDNVDAVIKLADGSLGLAYDICTHDGVSLYQKMMVLLDKSTDPPVEEIKNFVDNAASVPEAFDLVKTFLLNWISDQAKKNALKNPFITEDWLDLYQEVYQLFTDIDRIYLDKKQVLQTAFFKITEVLT